MYFSTLWTGTERSTFPFRTSNQSSIKVIPIPHSIHIIYANYFRVFIFIHSSLLWLTLISHVQMLKYIYTEPLSVHTVTMVCHSHTVPHKWCIRGWKSLYYNVLHTKIMKVNKISTRYLKNVLHIFGICMPYTSK